MHLSDKTLEALEFASIAHRTQQRKGALHVPYISHPAMVGTLLSRGNFDEEVVIGGILHDVIEDTEFGYNDIVDRFGVVVADLVQHVTEDMNLPYLDRKQKYLDNLKTAPQSALAISMTDSMANLMSINVYERVYESEVHGAYKDAIRSLVKNGRLKLEIVSSRMDHPFIEIWQSVFEKAVLIAKKHNV